MLRGCGFLILALLLSPGLPPALFAQSQQPIAVITELKFNRGEVQIRQAGGKAPERPGVLQSLYPGTVVQTTQDAIAVVFFTDGTRTVTVNEQNPSFEVKLVAANDKAANAGVKNVAGLLLGKKKPPTYVALAVRGKAQAPTLLSPRNGKIISETPTFHWTAVNHQPATIKVFGPEGVLWSAENINLTRIAYPTSAPRLLPDIEYAWVLEKKGFPPGKTTFKLVPPAEVAAIQNQLTELTLLGEISRTTLAVLKANFLMSRELFHEARELLLEGVAADPDEPTLHFVLGELYDKIGLRSLATEEYGAAEFLVKAKP
jgi:hypothetical protein